MKTKEMRKKNLNNREYCFTKIHEVSEFLPDNYTFLVNRLAEKKGLEPFNETRIRNVKNLVTPDKQIADLLWEIGDNIRSLIS